VSTALTRWPRVVVLLGLTSLLNDVASEMVVPVLPAFVATLGGGGLALGLIDGLAELVAALLKGWSGRASDRLGASRPFVLGGYTLAAVARPFLAVASAPWHVVAVRVADRVGKGLRSAPRDALLAGAVPEAERGAAFGFHRRWTTRGRCWARW
jgi:MFS family permease